MPISISVVAELGGIKTRESPCASRQRAVEDQRLRTGGLERAAPVLLRCDPVKSWVHRMSGSTSHVPLPPHLMKLLGGAAGPAADLAQPTERPSTGVPSSGLRADSGSGGRADGPNEAGGGGGTSATPHAAQRCMSNGSRAIDLATLQTPESGNYQRHPTFTDSFGARARVSPPRT